MTQPTTQVSVEMPSFAWFTAMWQRAFWSLLAVLFVYGCFFGSVAFVISIFWPR